MRTLLKHRRELVSNNLPDNAIGQLVTAGSLRRLRRGWYVAEDQWQSLTSVEQYRLKILVTHLNASDAIVFSHFSAAALLNLPLLRQDTSRVHTVTNRNSRRRNTAAILHHRTPFSASEVDAVGELAVTSLVRTVLDVARTGSFVAGVMCADAALRRLVAEGQDVDSAKNELINHLVSMQPISGQRKAIRVLNFASHKSESAFESLSRLQLARLGFIIVEQVAVPKHNGGEYRMDFEFVGLNTFGEADGRNKYLDNEMLSGRSAAETVLAEKQREDWVRGVTGKRVVRWTWEDAWDLNRFANKLRAFGLEPPNRLPDPNLF